MIDLPTSLREKSKYYNERRCIIIKSNVGTELTVVAMYNREKGVALGAISGYGTDRSSDA